MDTGKEEQRDRQTLAPPNNQLLLGSRFELVKSNVLPGTLHLVALELTRPSLVVSQSILFPLRHQRDT